MDNDPENSDRAIEDPAITLLLEAAGDGDVHAADELLELVYGELRRLARGQMARLPSGQTLQPTALVHEAYLRLLGRTDLSWRDRGQFFATAARAMRDVLVERARAQAALKRGGVGRRVTLDEGLLDPADAPEEFLAVHAALDRLEQVDGDAAQIVLLRFFAGLSSEETAAALGIGQRSVERHWAYAKAWLHDEIKRER